MWEKLKYIFHKLPLLCMILICGLLFRVAGLFCLPSMGEDYHFVQNPVYSLTFDGIKSAFFSHSDAASSADTQTAAEPSDTPETQKPADPGLSKAEKKLAKIRGYVSAKKEAKIRKKPLAKIIAKRKKASGNTYIHAKSFPKSATRPVMQAVDYEIADPVYNDPFGTTYDYLDKGPFKQNGDYYSFTGVEDGYFDNALFIGDSLTDGLREYGDAIDQHASFFAMESLTIYNIFDVAIPFRSPTETFDGSLDYVLSSHSFGKIYICLGMNEMGVPATTQFREQYIAVIRRIRKAQPKAIIFIEGLLHVDYQRSMGDPVYNNKAVIQRNEAISKLANGHDIFYIEPTEPFCDEDGNMVADYTNDGIHPVAAYYPLWKNYLKQYAIVRSKADR